MISKASFVALLNAVEAQMEQDSISGDILTQLADPEFQYHKVIVTTPLIDKVLKTLSYEVEDFSHSVIGTEISHWVWELDFGKKSKELQVTREDGSIVPLETPEQLYDWIMEQRNYVNPQAWKGKQ